MEYADADRLFGALGREDDWAFPFAPEGTEHKLDDGAILSVCEKFGRTDISICHGEQYAGYRVDDEVKDTVESAL